MLFKCIKADIEVDDAEFDLVFPKKVRNVSAIHFTPVEVAKQAARYLSTKKGSKILDIGAGSGKFCMIGSACAEEDYFIGVEQRKALCTVAERISKKYKLPNVKFIHSNITEVSFKDFDGFYFFNSFYENVTLLGQIDNTIEGSRELYEKYSNYVRDQLDTMPIGTRLVTYFSFLKEVPDSYALNMTTFDCKLKMWEKIC